MKECLEMREEGGRQGCIQLLSSDLKRCDRSGNFGKFGKKKKKKFESSMNNYRMSVLEHSRYHLTKKPHLEGEKIHDQRG